MFPTTKDSPAVQISSHYIVPLLRVERPSSNPSMTLRRCHFEFFRPKENTISIGLKAQWGKGTLAQVREYNKYPSDNIPRDTEWE